MTAHPAFGLSARGHLHGAFTSGGCHGRWIRTRAAAHRTSRPPQQDRRACGASASARGRERCPGRPGSHRAVDRAAIRAVLPGDAAWTVYLAGSLPSRQLSPNYAAAWTGFDVILLCALASTAYFALRRSRYLSSAATSTATLLVVDAWFDVMTTPGDQRWQSLLLAVAVELPLAALCLWLSYHTEQLAARRLRLLLWRRSRSRQVTTVRASGVAGEGNPRSRW